MAISLKALTALASHLLATFTAPPIDPSPFPCNLTASVPSPLLVSRYQVQWGYDCFGAPLHEGPVFWSSGPVLIQTEEQEQVADTSQATPLKPQPTCGVVPTCHLDRAVDEWLCGYQVVNFNDTAPAPIEHPACFTLPKELASAPIESCITSSSATPLLAEATSTAADIAVPFLLAAPSVNEAQGCALSFCTSGIGRVWANAYADFQSRPKHRVFTIQLSSILNRLKGRRFNAAFTLCATFLLVAFYGIKGRFLKQETSAVASAIAGDGRRVRRRRAGVQNIGVRRSAIRMTVAPPVVAPSALVFPRYKGEERSFIELVSPA